MELHPSLFCLFFCLLHFFLPPFEDLGCFSGCLMASAGIQKLFCGIYSAFKCSFDEFVGEKVFSLSYSSTIFQFSPYLTSLWSLALLITHLRFSKLLFMLIFWILFYYSLFALSYLVFVPSH